jgi:Carboxypeptidase regulatory-like domain
VFRSRMLGCAAGLAMVAGMVSVAGAQQDDHGRKWKPLTPLSHIVVTVVKGFDGKPLPNAAVVFHATMNGRDDGNMEVKTDPDGKATIDVIEVGSDVSVQVIANGFATFAQDINVVGANKILEVKLIRPREQVSQYQDTSGKAAQVKPGIQEPPHPVLTKPQIGPDGFALPQTNPPAPQTPQTPPPTSTGTPQ